jgi:hypothetical protein
MKLLWPQFKALAVQHSATVLETTDADNLSFRLKFVLSGVLVECNVFKGTPDEEDYAASLQPGAVK